MAHTCPKCYIFHVWEQKGWGGAGEGLRLKFRLYVEIKRLFGFNPLLLYLPSDFRALVRKSVELGIPVCKLLRIVTAGTTRCRPASSASASCA